MNGQPRFESQFTIGKLDAGMAILIGQGSHVVEFPSVLLPFGCEPGAVVTIACQRDETAEQKASKAFWHLQDEILAAFGSDSPTPPVLRLRNVTQTSITLEWDPLRLASAKLLSLSIWRNGQRLSAIPNPTTNTSTKLSGLDLDSPYALHLILKTTAGTYSSNIVKTRTHTIANTTGIRVCFGTVEPPELLEACKDALDSMKAGWSNSIQIDTTHFVCTSPASSEQAPQASQLYQRAVQMSIPTVVPSWLEACKTEKKLVPIAKHYLGTASTQPATSRPSQSSIHRSVPPAREEPEQPAPRASTSTAVLPADGPPVYQSQEELPDAPKSEEAPQEEAQNPVVDEEPAEGSDAPTPAEGSAIEEEAHAWQADPEPEPEQEPEALPATPPHDQKPLPETVEEPKAEQVPEPDTEVKEPELESEPEAAVQETALETEVAKDEPVEETQPVKEAEPEPQAEPEEVEPVEEAEPVKEAVPVEAEPVKEAEPVEEPVPEPQSEVEEQRGALESPIKEEELAEVSVGTVVDHQPDLQALGSGEEAQDEDEGSASTETVLAPEAPTKDDAGSEVQLDAAADTKVEPAAHPFGQLSNESGDLEEVSLG